jgi:rhamnosyltransferase subunit B
MPMAYDQLDNGTRLARLGVGGVIPVEKFKARRVAAILGELISSDQVGEKCRELASRCDGAASLDAAADLIEGLHERRAETVR